ncbi:putative DNA-binding transcriptional regulator YafY [Pedobacter sp. CG_S7]|uniref:helix-turn-helix transcriptional regulator n=1 Tax=Pedobacter sp. CG_S7 TaxID=3143930 RepID=UPI0033909B50
MNRINRLSAILIQLQSRRTVKAQDIADRFQISLRTVYRDIRSLEEAGVPILGEAGIGYALAEGYRLPPVMFTREEALAFITAEKLVLSLTDATNGKYYSTALYKIRAVLKTTEKDYLEQLDNRIQVLRTNKPPELQSHHNPLQTILHAIAIRQVMQLNYFAYYRQIHTQRIIEPIGVFYLSPYWHLIAYCRERKAFRDFRFDRITDISTTSEKFIDVHPSLKTILNDQYKEMQLQEVILSIDQHACLHLGEQKYYQGYVFENQTSKGVEMHFLTVSLEGFARWYMTFADHANIIHPVALLTRVKTLFSAISEKLEN